MPRIANIFDGTRAERAAAARSFTVGILHDSDRILQVMRIIFREIPTFRVPLSRSKTSGWRALPDSQRVAGSVDDIGHPPTRFFFPSSEQAVESQGRSFSRRRDSKVRTERHRGALPDSHAHRKFDRYRTDIARTWRDHNNSRSSLTESHGRRCSIR